MASKRILLLTALCMLMLGVPAWQAQNSPAQDVLPQVEERPMQRPPAQEAQPQEPMAQEPTGQEATAAEHDMQAAETTDKGPERSSKEAKEAKRDNDKPVAKSELTNPVLWRDPGNIASKHLFWGPGGPQRRPRPPFTFISEVTTGHSPKFECRDANGTKWTVKLGQEARPEAVASRLLWAIGYFADENYVLPKAQIRGLKMQRTSGKVKGTTVIDARFERKPAGQHKIGTWRWADNPFFGTREFNGLRVMMAVMNNWDLKSSNTAVYETRDRRQQLFLVSDVGSTFAGTSFGVPTPRGDPGKYERSQFIQKNDGMAVDFKTPSTSKGLMVMTLGVGAIVAAMYEQMDWIGNNIPVTDAHWIGTLLGQLSRQQLEDAFRAGNFPPRDIERFVTVLESRIRELQGL